MLAAIAGSTSHGFPVTFNDSGEELTLSVSNRLFLTWFNIFASPADFQHLPIVIAILYYMRFDFL